MKFPTCSDIDPASLIDVAIRAGEAIMEIYARDFEVEYKGDDSPLTEADKKGNDMIMGHLTVSYPNIPVISEENKLIEYADRKDWNQFFLLDPLDGTKEFIKKNGEFTVNIALIKDGRPIMGVVHRPVDKTTYLGIVGEGAWKIDAEGDAVAIEGGAHYSEKDSVLVVASRSHLTAEVEAFVEDLRAKGKKVEFLSAGSSLKLCLVAEGKADVYPRFGPTMEWDTGAADAVATAAGKKVLNAETREPLAYNKENLLNPFFIVE